jgi:phosphoglycerate dehydrogenase-like enzyme
VRSYVHEGVFERGIVVTNASSAIAVSVAETTIGLIISSLRHLMSHNEDLKSGKRVGGLPPTHELTGRTVGIVGMGEVGRRVMRLLGPFGCKILVYDPHRRGEEIEELGGSQVDLETLMVQSEVVSLHAPNIPSNYHMITRNMLGMLMDDAVLVNTARGELIDEEALVEEAMSGRIRVALDVFEAPAGDVGKRLARAQNAILTPHIAGKSVEARRRQGDVVVEDLALFFSGKTPKNLVTLEMLDWMA